MILETLFNIDSGYLEGLVRGFKCGILKQSDYLNLVQCETLEGKDRPDFVSRCSVDRIVSVWPQGESVSPPTSVGGRR